MTIKAVRTWDINLRGLSRRFVTSLTELTTITVYTALICMINETLRNWKNVNIFFEQTLEICSSCQEESRNSTCRDFLLTLINYSTDFALILLQESTFQWLWNEWSRSQKGFVQRISLESLTNHNWSDDCERMCPLQATEGLPVLSKQTWIIRFRLGNQIEKHENKISGRAPHEKYCSTGFILHGNSKL